MELKEFLQLKHPEEYDFKNEAGNDLFACLDSCIEKFIMYKAGECLRSRYFPEMDIHIKEDKKHFGLKNIDCDTSPLALEIYLILWRDAILNAENSGITGQNGETMTSFQKLFNLIVESKIETNDQAIYRKKNYPTKGNYVTKRYITHLYYENRDFIKTCSMNKAAMDYAKVVHSIGNLLPVPRWFNANRAHHDSWDLTMCKIREWYLEKDEQKRECILRKLLCNKDSVVNECKKWLLWCAKGEASLEGWKNFVTCNYLQAFVNMDDGWTPKMFCPNHNWDSKITGEEAEIICETCDQLIKVRGAQMIEALRKNIYQRSVIP